MQHIDHRRILVHHENGAAPEGCRILLQVDEIHLHVEHVRSEKSPGGPAHEGALELLAFADARRRIRR